MFAFIKVAFGSPLPWSRTWGYFYYDDILLTILNVEPIFTITALGYNKHSCIRILCRRY